MKNSLEQITKNASERAKHFSDAILALQDSLQKQLKSLQAFEKFIVEMCAHRQDNTQREKQLHVIAVGKSGVVARLAVSMFASVGFLSRFLHPTEAFHGDLGSIRPDDIILAISNNGRSSEILELIPRLKERNCILFAMTSRADSPLAQQCDHVFLLPSVEEACPLNQAPLTSTLTSLALCQLLVAATMEYREFDLPSYAKNHPGGVIGRRIFLKVSDVMTKKESTPTISPDTLFPQIISALTLSGKGGVLVTDKTNALLGIVAERDIRQAMEKCDRKVFDLSARDLMNANPVTISPETLALDALKIMENRKRPLNFLPVCDAEKKLSGMIHLHDLIGLGFSLNM